jgi:hypothetical protein
MIKESDKRYRIQVMLNGNYLTYNNCRILKDESGWITFTDKFNKTFILNKNSITIMEVLEDGN